MLRFSSLRIPGNLLWIPRPLLATLPAAMSLCIFIGHARVGYGEGQHEDEQGAPDAQLGDLHGRHVVKGRLQPGNQNRLPRLVHRLWRRAQSEQMANSADTIRLSGTTGSSGADGPISAGYINREGYARISGRGAEHHERRMYQLAGPVAGRSLVEQRT